MQTSEIDLESIGRIEHIVLPKPPFADQPLLPNQPSDQPFQERSHCTGPREPNAELRDSEADRSDQYCAAEQWPARVQQWDQPREQPLTLPGEQPAVPRPRRRAKGAGRKPLLDDAKKREICAIVQSGAGIGSAAQYVGCAPRTIRKAAARDAAFDRKLRSAFLQADLLPLQGIREAARTNWRAGAWLLEHTTGGHYQKPSPKLMSASTFRETFFEVMDLVSDSIADEPTRQFVVDQLRKLVNDKVAQADAQQSTPKRR